MFIWPMLSVTLQRVPWRIVDVVWRLSVFRLVRAGLFGLGNFPRTHTLAIYMKNYARVEKKVTLGRKSLAWAPDGLTTNGKKLCLRANLSSKDRPSSVSYDLPLKTARKTHQSGVAACATLSSVSSSSSSSRSQKAAMLGCWLLSCAWPPLALSVTARCIAVMDTLRDPPRTASYLSVPPCSVRGCLPELASMYI